MASREDEWAALYDALVETLGEFGKNDAFGEGDYWLVDDDWGGLLHKIVVSGPDFWSDQLQQRVRETLKGFPQWGLLVVFDDHLAKLIEDNGGDGRLDAVMDNPSPEEVSKFKT